MGTVDPAMCATSLALYTLVSLIQRQWVLFLSLVWGKPDCFSQHLENQPA